MELVMLKNVCKTYPNSEALKNVSLTVKKGHIVGLLGPNGCGKTTLIKVLAGLINDYEGEVLIDFENPGTYTKSVVAYMPEKPSFPDWMRISDAIAYYTDFYTDFDPVHAGATLNKFSLSPNSKIKTLSNGTRSKTALILTMSRRAKLYLLDEPFGGIDPLAREEALGIITDNLPEDASLIMSTHLLSDVEQVFDDIVFMSNGGVVIYDSADNIRSNSGKTLEGYFKEVFKC